MKKIQVEGWVAIDERGRVPRDQTVPHSEFSAGFPRVRRASHAIPERYSAHKVLVTIEDYPEVAL